MQHDNLTEHPSTINVLARMNVYQEVVLAAIYRTFPFIKVRNRALRQTINVLTRMNYQRPREDKSTSSNVYQEVVLAAIYRTFPFIKVGKRPCPREDESTIYFLARKIQTVVLTVIYRTFPFIKLGHYFTGIKFCYLIVEIYDLLREPILEGHKLSRI